MLASDDDSLSDSDPNFDWTAEAEVSTAFRLLEAISIVDDSGDDDTKVPSRPQPTAKRRPAQGGSRNNA